MNIITGYKGEAHVTAQQDRDINSAIFSTGAYILNIGSKLEATVVSANEITIADGLIVAEGCAAEVERGTSESMTIDNGTQGMLRKDLIVMRYAKNASTGVEDMDLAVIKGTPAASSPVAPAYNTGSIAQGDTIVDFPLYEVNLDGIAIDSVVRVPDVVSIAKQNDVTSLATAVASLVNKIGNVAMGTVATTITGAIKELLTSLNSAVSRITALETVTGGIERTTTYTVSASATDYKQLVAGRAYILVINSLYPSDTLKGVYLIGVAGNGAIGIKTVNNASDVAVSDGGSTLLKVKNNSGAAALRCTLITTYSS